MNVLRITETATHMRSASTRLEALPVFVLRDIPATGSPAQVTNFVFLRKFLRRIRTVATIYYHPRVSITKHRKYLYM